MEATDKPKEEPAQEKVEEKKEEQKTEDKPETVENKVEASGQVTESSAPKKKNFFKIKVAMFFGYNGKAYKGLQKQKDLAEKTTVESCIEIALHEAGLVSDANFGRF